MEIGFRPLVLADLPLVHAWLGRPHVARWWGERGPLEQTIARYEPAIEGREPTDLYAIVLDGRDAGMIQTYRVADHPEYAALVGVGVGEGVAGLDLFLGEPEMLGRGIGTRVIDAFTAGVVLARPGTTACVADPDADNAVSLRAFARAGFVPVRDFVDPVDGRLHVLVCRDRERAGA